jgi:hypothetical protein
MIDLTFILQDRLGQYSETNDQIKVWLMFPRFGEI